MHSSICPYKQMFDACMSPLWSQPRCSPERRGALRGAPPPGRRLMEPWAGGRGRPAPLAPEETGTSPWRRRGMRWGGRPPSRSSSRARPAGTPPRNTPPRPRSAAWRAEDVYGTMTDRLFRKMPWMERCWVATWWRVRHGGWPSISCSCVCRGWMGGRRRGGVAATVEKNWHYIHLNIRSEH